ncbi:MAG: hypothetical protein K2H46_00130 [Muribaculaceae bacterium]|nr:hypothetical protein [Muribaculaceae bacterium]
MTVDQYIRATEIVRELDDIKKTWNTANNPASRITNSDGTPCDRKEALEELGKELQARADRLKREFNEL